MLPLDWAYRNARLVCRPDSDWLDASEISEGDEQEAQRCQLLREASMSDGQAFLAGRGESRSCNSMGWRYRSFQLVRARGA